MFDTFIGDDETWDALKENMRLIYRQRNLVQKLAIRREVVSLFYDFLEERLEKIVAQARMRGLGPQWCINSLARAKSNFHEDISRALSSARRIYGGGSETEALPLFQQSPTR